ncbi:MAG TPA: alpha/beta hydrolase [Acetobacteraceae bacterium]|nr:alpha/beta hydrolase [Acetobacteraceae bacterium]
MPEDAVSVTGRLDRGDGVELAWARVVGRGPTVVFLPGFRSDMTGDKATALAAFCAERGHAMLRFDYSGHGVSGGEFEDGSIGRWTEDALAVIDGLTEGSLVLVGSSMGGWIALLAALARRDRVIALIGIAAAPDFTERLMWQVMTAEQRLRLIRDGVFQRPSEYGEPYPITRHLIEEARGRLLLNAPIALDCPVRLLHGQADADVPWRTTLSIAARLTSSDVQVMLVKDGDHRLSRPQDLALLRRTLAPLLGQDGA